LDALPSSEVKLMATLKVVKPVEYRLNLNEKELSYILVALEQSGWPSYPLYDLINTTLDLSKERRAEIEKELNLDKGK
jgi:hypothetical protein